MECTVCICIVTEILFAKLLEDLRLYGKFMAVRILFFEDTCFCGVVVISRCIEWLVALD